jgi:hypothetical protein
MFFNKGLISDFILLGTADKHDFFPEKMSSFCFLFSLKYFLKKNILSQETTIANLPNNAWVQNNLEKMAQ